MRTRLLFAALVVALLAACGGGGSDDPQVGGADGAASDDGTADGGGTDAADDGADGGDVDCASITEAMQGLGLARQILAQLTTLEQYQLVKDGTLTFDAAATLEDIAVLRALEGIEIPAGNGSVKESLDLYEEAATLARENLAVDDPFAEAKGEELVALAGDTPEEVGEFLGAQIALSFALDGTDC